MGGMTRLLLLLWAGVTVGSVVDLQKRIYGGQDCGRDEHLYHVQLRKSAPHDTFICGGSLISAQWILTAAHCRDNNLYAVVGVHPDPSKGTRVEVTPHFFGVGHDIMLLEITKPNTIQKHYINLPDCGNPPKVVQIAGHAKTSRNNIDEKETEDSKTLLCADTNVVDCEDFRDRLVHLDAERSKSRVNEHWLCFQKPGVDVSVGDSGGGVVFNGMIYGVISFSDKLIPRKPLPSVAMDVCADIYMKWIKTTTGIP